MHDELLKSFAAVPQHLPPAAQTESGEERIGHGLRHRHRRIWHGTRGALDQFSGGEDQPRAGLQPPGGGAPAGLPAPVHPPDADRLQRHAGRLRADPADPLPAQSRHRRAHHPGRRGRPAAHRPVHRRRLHRAVRRHRRPAVSTSPGSGSACSPTCAATCSTTCSGSRWATTTPTSSA